MRPIPYGRQDIDQDDIDAVVAVLRSDWLTQGPAVEYFEDAMARYCGVSHATAVNSATSALHMACLALGLGPGDSLWTSPNTFVASANCGLYCGARVDFVDVDPLTYNMCPRALEQKLERAAQEGRLPKVVIPVHFSGQPCALEAIHALGQRYGFRIIEDASHAVGASYRDGRIGGCRFSDITVFSFHPVKILTTGEGGMLTTSDPILSERLRQLRSHGITRDVRVMTGASHGPWYYEQQLLGFNYRITDIQCALGASQLSRLDQMLARRRALAARYDEMLRGLPLVTPYQHPDGLSAWHLYVVRLDAGIDRGAVFEKLRAAGIGVNVHYIPVHTQPYYQSLGFKQGDFPVAEAYYAQAISLPMFSALSSEDQDHVIDVLRQQLA